MKPGRQREGLAQADRNVLRRFLCAVWKNAVPTGRWARSDESKAALGWKHVPERIKPLKGILLMMALPPLYAALSVRIEGRAIWSLYPFLIPIAVFMRLPRR